MKKIILCISTVLLLLALSPSQLKAVADTDPVLITLNEAVVPADAEALIARLDYIKAMDKSALNSSEKKDLRKEVRDIRSTLMESGGGIYLSVGAAILIILLLILLL